MIKHAIAETVALEIIRFISTNNLIGVEYYEAEGVADVKRSSTAHGQISAKLVDIGEELLT